MTDHFPIITILELPQTRVKPSLAYDFRAAEWADFLENLHLWLAEIPDAAPCLMTNPSNKPSTTSQKL
jgi:hypothetical protein